jgi:phage/plasmid-associated DNA primase
LWTGFGVEPERGDWNLMREHIRTVLAAGDADVSAYILNWLADAVQRPNKQAEVALVFLGGFGTGRGILGRSMCRIFGQHGRHISSSEHITGKHNAHLQMCCFLFADEAVAPGDKRAEGALKRTITEDTLFIEPKGVDAFEVPNRLHAMLATNHEQAVSAGEKERRYVVQKVAEARQQDEGWFAPIYVQMRDGGLQAMLYDLSTTTSKASPRAASSAPRRSPNNKRKASRPSTSGS